MNCQEFFDSVKDEKEPCKLLQQHPEPLQLAWESECASIHSSSVVQNQESLARQVVDPTHFDQITNTIKPTFFDDAASIGASCHRLLYTTEDQICQMTESRVTQANLNPPKTGVRTAIGYAVIDVEEIRLIKTDGDPGRRGAAVFDTARADDVSHADICQLVSGRQEGKSVRAQLWMLSKDRLVRFDFSSALDSNSGESIAE